MKKTKIALTLVCAILIVAASVMGTLAYLTATTETVTNTFTVGNVKFAADALDEALVDEYGNPGKMVKNEETQTEEFTKVDDIKNADRVTANTYKLIPGHKYTKDPKIHMDANSEACYLFVTVNNQITALEDANDTIAQQMAAKGWKEVKDNNVVVAYIYYGTTTTTNPDGSTTTTVNSAKTQVDGGTTVDVFDYFKLSTTANVDETDEDDDGNDYFVNAGKTITIKAYAIQADGIPETMTDYQLWQQASASTT